MFVNKIGNNNNIYLKSNIHSIIRYKFSGLYKNMVSTLRLYSAYKKNSEIDSTQLCINTVISIVLVINHGYTTIRKSAID